MSSNYITSAELARRCDVSRAAVSLAIRDQRVDPAKVRRAGGRVLVEQQHGMSVLGHHAATPRPAPAPAEPTTPVVDTDLGALFAWGALPVACDQDELKGQAEVDDLVKQIDDWSELVNQLENQLRSWVKEYSEFREWITTSFAHEAITYTFSQQKLKEHPVGRNAVCDAQQFLCKQLKPLDELEIIAKLK